MRTHDSDADDVELDEMESDAFLPSEQSQRSAHALKSSKQSPLTRWIPRRIRMVFENISRLRLMIILLSIFLIMFAVMVFFNNRPIHIPSASIKLSEALAIELSGTAIPDYVLTYAPIVYLSKSDNFFPSDLTYHLNHVTPTLNFTALPSAPSPLTLDNLDALNSLAGPDDPDGMEVSLSSKSDLGKSPKYLHGKRPHLKTLDMGKRKSSVVIVNDRGNGEVDAFYMYFYTFNQGPMVLGHELGDHLGDWEHNMIRFHDGLPQSIWYSQHAYGAAYSYACVEKAGARPVVYSAKGSHANYATSGRHDLHELDHEIPKNIAFDHTSRGPLWDPTLSAYFYTLSSNHTSSSAPSPPMPPTPPTPPTPPSPPVSPRAPTIPSNLKFIPINEKTPVNYLYFNGRWGDDEFPASDSRQQDFHNFKKWIGGPRGGG